MAPATQKTGAGGKGSGPKPTHFTNPSSNFQWHFISWVCGGGLGDGECVYIYCVCLFVCLFV